MSRGLYLLYSYVETSLGTKLTIVIASLESVIDFGYLVLGILRQPLREIDTRLAVRRRPLSARLAPSGLLAVVASSCHGTQHEARLPTRQQRTAEMSQEPLVPQLTGYGEMLPPAPEPKRTK